MGEYCGFLPESLMAVHRGVVAQNSSPGSERPGHTVLTGNRPLLTASRLFQLASFTFSGAKGSVSRCPFEMFESLSSPSGAHGEKEFLSLEAALHQNAKL